MSWIALGFGLVLIIEGLVFALAPSRIEDLLAAIGALGREQRRWIGLGAMVLGLGLVWLGRALGI